MYKEGVWLHWEVRFEYLTA